MIALVRVYQIVISPALPASTCRFTPTCSQYMIDAVRIYGPVRGIARGVRRIFRCHPGRPGGYDPA